MKNSNLIPKQKGAVSWSGDNLVNLTNKEIKEEVK